MSQAIPMDQNSKDQMFIVQALKVQGQNVPNFQRPRLKCPKFKRPRLKRPRFICPIVRGLNDQRFIWPRAKRPNTKRPRLKCTLDQFSKNKRPGFECTLRLVFVYFFITVYCIIKEGQNTIIIYYIQYVRVCTSMCSSCFKDSFKESSLCKLLISIACVKDLKFKNLSNKRYFT